jgi:catechol 2,3-dioxygenase-like lactoylglutathione lyase family enzyme
MKVHRIVANIRAADVAKADAFYQRVLGLKIVMDQGVDTHLRVKREDDCAAQRRDRRWLRYASARPVNGATSIDSPTAVLT